MFLTRLLGLSVITCLFLSSPVFAQSAWNLPHKQGTPVKSPDANERIKLKNSVIDGILTKKKSGFFSDKSIILGTRYNFDLDQADKARLKNAGFSSDVISDLEAKGKWLHKKGNQPLKGQLIQEPDRLFHKLVTANQDKILRAELRDVWDGLCEIDFVNQADHTVYLHYLTFGKGNRNISFISDLRHNDTDPAGSNVLNAMARGSRGRFGQKMVDYYDSLLMPHEDNMDKSRFDIWKQENTFKGTSIAFNDPKWKDQPPNPASIRKTGDHVRHYRLHVEDPLKSGPMDVDAFYCYSYRNNDGALFSACKELKGTCNKGEQEKPSFDLGLKASLEVSGPEFELAKLPYGDTIKRDVAKDGMGSGQYQTGLVTYQIEKNKSGKENLYIYMLDTDPKRNPREKFYVAIRLFPESDDYRGAYTLSKESTHQLSAGLFISEFHFSNHQKVGRNNKMMQLDIQRGEVDIHAVTDEGLFGTIDLDANYTFRLSPDYSDKDECVKGREDKEECNPEYQIRLTNTSFGARKR